MRPMHVPYAYAGAVYTVAYDVYIFTHVYCMYMQAGVYAVAYAVFAAALPFFTGALMSVKMEVNTCM